MRKWESEIVQALTTAGRPMSMRELTEAVIGPTPNPKWVSFQAGAQAACNRGVIVRTGRAPRGPYPFMYALPKENA